MIFLTTCHTQGSLRNGNLCFGHQIRRRRYDDCRYLGYDPQRMKSDHFVTQKYTASYGSLARFRSVHRMKRFGKDTLIGASGEMSDFQYLEQILEELVCAVPVFQKSIKPFVSPQPRTENGTVLSWMGAALVLQRFTATSCEFCMDEGTSSTLFGTSWLLREFAMERGNLICPVLRSPRKSKLTFASAAFWDLSIRWAQAIRMRLSRQAMAHTSLVLC